MPVKGQADWFCAKPVRKKNYAVFRRTDSLRYSKGMHRGYRRYSLASAVDYALATGAGCGLTSSLIHRRYRYFCCRYDGAHTVKGQRTSGIVVRQARNTFKNTDRLPFAQGMLRLLP